MLERAKTIVTRRLGPAPLWAWALAAVAVLYLMWRRRQQAAADAGTVSTDNPADGEAGASSLAGLDGQGGAYATPYYATPPAPLATTKPGRGTVTVPNVIGLSRQRALLALGRAGLRLKVAQIRRTRAYHDGEIIRQEPAGGLRRKRGTVVSVVLVKAPPQHRHGARRHSHPPARNAGQTS